MILLSKTNKFKNITFKQGLSELKHENQIYIGIKEKDDEMIFELQPMYSQIKNSDGINVKVYGSISDIGNPTQIWTSGYIDMFLIYDVIGEDFEIVVNAYVSLSNLQDYNLYIKKEE